MIGAAHAACFSMALASLLAKAGSPATSVKTDASVTLPLVDIRSRAATMEGEWQHALADLADDLDRHVEAL